MPLRRDDDLLQRMLNVTPDPAAPSPADRRGARPRQYGGTPRDPAPLRPPTPVRGLYRRLGTTVALLSAAAIGGLLWYVSSRFTLDFLGTIFPDLRRTLERAPWWQSWLIPLAISAIEIFLWPRRERRLGVFVLRLLLWLSILALDVATTIHGILPLLQAQPLPVAIDATARTWLELGVSGASGVIFAYAPEKIGRWVVNDLWALWLASIWRWFRPNEAATA